MEPIHIRFGGYQPPTSVHNKAAEVFGNALATRLGDAVAFSLDGNIIASFSSKPSVEGAIHSMNPA
jgi:hypothetical protein